MRGRVRAAALLAALAIAACTPAPERLTLDGRTITLFNDSDEAWTDVEIWVNDHYRVTRPRVAAGERFQVSLESFAAGFGQRFPRGQPVAGIEVTATAAGGPVRLVYGSGRRR